MSDYLDTKNVKKTRKKHNCFGCGLDIPIGSPAVVSVYVEDGDICSIYYCEVCDAYWKEYGEDYDEIGYGELLHENPEEWHAVRRRIGGAGYMWKKKIMLKSIECDEIFAPEDCNLWVRCGKVYKQELATLDNGRVVIKSKDVSDEYEIHFIESEYDECEYCKEEFGNKKIADSESSTLEVVRDGECGPYYLRMYDGIRYESLSISACPKCGRELKSSGEQSHNI